MTTAQTLLPYADLPARWGVAVQREADLVRISVPPVPGWRFLSLGFLFSIPLLAAITLAYFGTMTYWAVRGAEWAPLIAPVAMYGCALLFVVVAAVGRLRNRSIFEVDSARLTIICQRGRTRQVIISTPRSMVVEVKFSQINRNLFVHVLGHDFIEVFISPNADVGRWVAEQIRAALKTVPLAVEGAAPVHRDTGDRLTSARARAVLLTIASGMACAGIAMLFMGTVPRVIGGYLIFLAVVPVGIALGTQPKKFWA